MPSGYSLTGVNVQEEGASTGFASTLNFTGAGVTATASGGTVTVNIPGGGGGGITGWTSYYDYTSTAGQTTFAAAGITALSAWLITRAGTRTKGRNTRAS